MQTALTAQNIPKRELNPWLLKPRNLEVGQNNAHATLQGNPVLNAARLSSTEEATSRPNPKFWNLENLLHHILHLVLLRLATSTRLLRASGAAAKH